MNTKEKNKMNQTEERKNMCKKIKQKDLTKEIQNLKEGQMLEITFYTEDTEVKKDETSEI